MREMVRCANRSRTATSVPKGSIPCVTHRFLSGWLHVPYALTEPAVSMQRTEAKVLALVPHHADLFQAAVAAVVPEQPFPAVEDGERLVAGVVVPLAFPRLNDGVG